MAAQKIDIDGQNYGYQKVRFAKTNIPFHVIVRPPKEAIQKLKSEIFSFIWDSKPDKIKRTTLYRDYRKWESKNDKS